MSMPRIPMAKELREFADALSVCNTPVACMLHVIADRIDERWEDELRRRDDYEAWLRAELDELRSEDRPEVVRCSGCRHAYLDHGAHVCNFRPLLAHYVSGDDFCSHGEVRDA